MSPQSGVDPFLEILEAKDPGPLVNQLRERDPVHYVAPLGFWFVTRYDDMKRLFNDPENATQDARAIEHFVPAREGTLLRSLQESRLSARGPEAHARFRKL